MLVVPLRGDNITNGEGINQTVKQYTGIKKKPACYVVGIKEPTYFEDIKQLKKLPVELHNGCFKVYGLIKRLYHLPQPGEYVSIYKNGNLQSLLVKDIKVHSEYHLLGGLIVVCENGDIVSLDMIVDIKGKYHNRFNQTAFLALYKDYV